LQQQKELKKRATYNLKFCSQKFTNMFPPETIEKSSLANYGIDKIDEQRKKKTGHYQQT